MMEWSIRGLLNPVITRLLIYGVNPIDVEFVVSAVEKKKHLHARSLELSWVEEWQKKAERYETLAREAENKRHTLSARDCFLYAAQCYYAIFLINLGDIEEKKRMYLRYAELYRQSLKSWHSHVEPLSIPLDDTHTLAGYLHYPVRETGKPTACVVIFAGLGSCKEEMHTLARPLAERGLFAFVPDMPGSGESLFVHNVKCQWPQIEAAFTRIPDALAARPTLLSGVFATYGLCMGGGYAYHAACVDARYRSCVNLFPLFISQVDEHVTPKWMREGEWAWYQRGTESASDFIEEMRQLEDGTLACPYLFIHGKYDNWMTIDAATKLYDRAQGSKDKIIIEEHPVFSNQEMVTHTMPVGEQLHWIRHVAADWLVEHCRA